MNKIKRNDMVIMRYIIVYKNIKNSGGRDKNFKLEENVS